MYIFYIVGCFSAETRGGARDAWRGVQACQGGVYYLCILGVETEKVRNLSPGVL